MAKLIFKTGATATTRRHGVVYATTPGLKDPTTGDHPNNPVIRAGSVPVHPLTLNQNYAQNTLSTVTALWAQLSPSEQLTWNGVGFYNQSAYTSFLAWNQRLLTWGLPLVRLGTTSPTIMNTLVIAAVHDPTAGDDSLSLLYIEPGGSTQPVYLWLYVQASSMQTIQYSGSAGNTPGLPGPIPYVKPSGYVYYGGVGPMLPNTFYSIPVPQGFIAIAGLPPINFSYNATTNQYTANAFDAQWYISDNNGTPFVTEVFGPPPNYDPYYRAVPGSQYCPFWPASPFSAAQKALVPPKGTPEPQLRLRGC